MVGALNLSFSWGYFLGALDNVAFVLKDKAVDVALSWDKVYFDVASSLLVTINYYCTERSWDFHAHVKAMNCCFKFVDGPSHHYGVVWIDHVNNVEGHLFYLALRFVPTERGSSILPSGNVPFPLKS
jgi:hypothetical protein